MSRAHNASHAYQGRTNGRSQRQNTKLWKGGLRPIDLKRLERLLLMPAAKAAR